MEDNNNNVPAAGEQVIFDEIPKAEEPKTEEVKVEETKTEEVKVEEVVPQEQIVKEVKEEIPVVEVPQQQYQNPQQFNPIPPDPVSVEPDSNPMTMGEWLVTLLLMCIPCVNIILLFVWAFGDKTGNLNRRNYAKAQLIIMGAVLAIYLLMIIVIAVVIGVSYVN